MDVPLILVVDDDADAREVLPEVLAMHGYQVITASRGDDGLVMFRDRRPDAVITDLSMPGVDGYDMAKFIRSEGGPSLPVIALSGQYAVRPSGAFDCILRKPVNPSLLLAWIEELLARR